MQGIRTILVDDEPRGLSMLRQLLEIYCPELKIVAECGDADLAKEKIELLDPQLVFLDISLPGKSSFEMLAEIKDIRFDIIFVTAHNKYAVQAFQYSAVDYLVKPIDEDLLQAAVRRFIKKREADALNSNLQTLLYNLQKPASSQEAKLCIPSQRGFQVVEINSIIYCEASGSYSHIYFADHPAICSSRQIHEYEALLEDVGFVRIHKSYLVNLLHIKEYVRGEGGLVILSNEKELEVSRRRKESFLSRLRSFFKH